MFTEPSICDIPYYIAVLTSNNTKLGSVFFYYIICFAYSTDMLGLVDDDIFIYLYIGKSIIFLILSKYL